MNEAEREEWDLPPQAESLPLAPEDQPRFQGLLTELALAGAGAVIFPASASFIPNPRAIMFPPPPALSLWEQAFYDGLPGVLTLLAIACVIWLLTIPLRMSELWRR